MAPDEASQAKPRRPESDACWPKYRQAWWTVCLSVSHSPPPPFSFSLLALFVCLCLSLSVSVSVFVYHFDLAQFVTGSLSSYGLLVGLVCLFAQPAYGHQQVPTPTTPYSALPPPLLMAAALTDMWQAAPALALALSRLLLLSCVSRCHPAASCGTHLPLHPLYCICSLFTYSFHVVLFASWFGFGLCCFCSCSMCGKLLFSLSHLVACSLSRSGQVSSRCCACCFFMSHAGCFSCRRHLPQVAHFVHQVKPLMSRPPAAANANQLATSAGHHHHHLLLFPAAKCKQQTELLRN